MELDWESYVQSVARTNLATGKTVSPEVIQPLPTIDLLLRPPIPLDTKSIGLLHHYTTHTCTTLTDPKAIDVWRKSIPQMAVSHPFLMHGILALSALHLRTLQPHRAAELGAIAITSEQAALPSFRRLVANLDPGNENIHAVFAFSTFVVPYMLGISGTFDDAIGRIPRIGEPHWFHAMRGWAALLKDHWKIIFDGPFKPVMGRTPDIIEYAFNPEDAHLASLHGMLTSSPSASEKDIEDLETCRSALDEWRRVCALPFAPSRTVSLGVSLFVWPGTVSEEYVQLLHEKRPEALVILAHYCVLLKRLGALWFLKGAGDKLMNAVVEELDEEWHPWMRWAMDQSSEPLSDPLYQPKAQRGSEHFSAKVRTPYMG